MLCQEQRASNLADEWAAATIQSLRKASPTSLKITLRSVFLRNNLISISIAPQSCVHQNIVVSFFLFLTLIQIREGRTQTIGECLRREYKMACHVVRGDFSRDFFEVNVNNLNTFMVIEDPYLRASSIF